jgi:predicted permease
MSLRRFFRRSQEDADLAHEVEAHLAHEIDDNLARGMSRDEARRQAYVKFGNPRRIRETVWETNRVEWAENIWRDIRHSVRALVRAPGFALVAVMVMALGIGANTALFTIVRSVLLKPLPFSDPERLVELYEQSPDGKVPYSWVAFGMFDEWKKQAPSIEQMAIFGGDSVNLSGTGGQLPEKLHTGVCSWNLFSMLGVAPYAGRLFAEPDDRSEAGATVVLTYGLWQRRYGGDPKIAGKTILLNAKPYTVIGVLPARYAYPDSRIQLWTAARHDTREEEVRAVDRHGFRVVARLRPDATMAQALSEVDTVEKRVHMETANPSVGKAASVRTLQDGLVHEYKTPLYALLAATSCVLLIACLNVANLLVARSASRRKELSIRAALGGSRWRLLQEQVTESLLLAITGGVVGLLLASAGVVWLVHARPDLSHVSTIHMDGVVIMFGVGMVALGGILAGLIPSLTLLRGSLLDSMQESTRANSAGPGRARLRKVLLIAEVGLTVVLLTSAGLLLKSYQRLRTIDIGCATDNVLTMNFSLPDARYKQPEQVTAFYEAFLPRLRTIPGVKAAGIASVLPGQGYYSDGHFTIAERPPIAKSTLQFAMIRGADPDYFRALQIPLLKGRYIESRERLDDVRSVIVSKSFVKKYFPNEEALGKHLKVSFLDKEPQGGFEIVGIVGDTRWELTSPADAVMYFPLLSGEWTQVAIGVRSDKDVSSLSLPIQKLLSQIDPDLPVSDVLTMEQFIGKSTLDASFTSFMVLAFAIVGLLLAAVGLYGVLSYLVTQRTNEIGIRIALGSERAQVLRIVMLDGLRPAWIGLILGLIGSGFVVQLIRNMLFGTSPLDWSIFAEVALLLFAVALIACAVPAWRASRLDPMQALRAE